MTTQAPCQVRSRTEDPCLRGAVVEIRGVGFCGPCAREQEAYFAIGELVARRGTRGLRGGPLAEALARMRRERAHGARGTVAGVRGGTSGVHNVGPLALRSS